MLMTRIEAPFALVDGSLCHLYTLNLAQVYLAASLCELIAAFVLAIQPDQVSLPRTSPNAQSVRAPSKIQHDPRWRVVAGVFLATHPSVHTAFHESGAHCR